MLKQVAALVASIAKARAIEVAAVRFQRREVREFTGLSNTQVAIHLDRLVALEYLIPHRGANGQTFVYELAYTPTGDGDDTPRLAGLIDVDDLRRLPSGSTLAAADAAAGHAYGENLPGSDPHLPGGFRPASGPLPATFRGDELPETSCLSHSIKEAAKNSKKTHEGEATDSARRSDTRTAIPPAADAAGGASAAGAA